MSVAEISKNRSHTQDELDETFYDTQTILCYERIFGHTYCYPGGEETVKDFTMELNMKRGARVLDIGSGLGGVAFYLARQYGARVTGVDYSKNMVRMANVRRERMEDQVANKVDFQVSDVVQCDFPKSSFDVIVSFGVILHIGDKETLFSKIKDWLKPDGKILITDYCRGDLDTEPTPTFKAYIDRFRFDLLTVKWYAERLQNAGINVTQAEDRSKKFEEITFKDLNMYYHLKDFLIEDYGKVVYEKSVESWKCKLDNTRSGELKMGFFIGSNS